MTEPVELWLEKMLYLTQMTSSKIITRSVRKMAAKKRKEKEEKRKRELEEKRKRELEEKRKRDTEKAQKTQDEAKADSDSEESVMFNVDFLKLCITNDPTIMGLPYFYTDGSTITKTCPCNIQSFFRCKN